MINVTGQEIQEGRKQYEDFLKGITGGFFTSLFDSISKAKGPNLFRIATGFPGETFAYLEYTGMLNMLHWTVDGKRYVPGITHD